MYILYYIVMKDLKQGGVLLNTTEYSDLLDSELAFCNHTFVYCSLQGKKMALVEKSQEKQNAQKTRSVFLSYNEATTFFCRRITAFLSIVFYQS